MILTESEAKTRWCPFARVNLGKDLAAANRDIYNDNAKARCIGSACMAWKWSAPVSRRFVKVMDYDDWRKLTYTAQERFVEPERPQGVGADWEWSQGDFEVVAGWFEPQSETDKRRPGFCGLAGQP